MNKYCKVAARILQAAFIGGYGNNKQGEKRGMLEPCLSG